MSKSSTVHYPQEGPTLCIIHTLAWKVISHILTIPSAPALASLLAPTHNTPLTPLDAAFRMAMFLRGFATLHTNTFVSSEPEAQCWESDVHASELIRAVCTDHRLVTSYTQCLGTSYGAEGDYDTFFSTTSNKIILPEDYISNKLCTS